MGGMAAHLIQPAISLASILGLAWLVHKTADRVIVAPLALLRGRLEAARG